MNDATNQIKNGSRISRTQRRPRTQVSIQNRNWFPWLLMSPTLTILLVVGIFPFAYSIWLASTNIILSRPQLETFFLGLENYQDLMQDPAFFNALRITLVYTISVVFIEFWAGLGLALLFKRNIRGKAVYRLLLLLPMIIPPLVVGLIWRYMLFPNSGLISYYANEFAALLNVSPPSFLSAPGSALRTLIFIDVWQWTAFMFLILSAGLAAIPPEPYEAAEIDGASSWRVFWTITLPMLRPAVLIALVIRTMDAFRTYDQIAVLTSGGPGSSTETLNIWLTNLGFRFFNVSKAAALSLIIFVIILVLSFVFVKVLSRTSIDDKE
ncbi:sugar ABC transporter permease [Marinovum sp. 2_MG-2023]|uniref:carbohydrate ABC transporter permease n=1 Tax=unclassified Marinovum TaxID=2647166 RepID=UPI0026E2398C|nr:MULTISPECIES: sugar ABC transporter permease [unclassified Marinovum]MDO6732760.1 sugar ABC transporter permease [Marinovum sp. 2_MG-2023]MDO6782034.1 sugar ABC transporter permease [Marinovum sp. 1_MG-2023]